MENAPVYALNMFDRFNGTGHLPPEEAGADGTVL
jgi:hypothetical protein